MKILLASDSKFLLSYGYKILGIPRDKIKIGYITTAASVAENKSFVETHKKEMTNAGYYYEEFDIAGKSKQEILDFFVGKNIVHVEGGNTFYLLKVIRETGFDEILKTLLSKGLVYVGTSAGAYVMCPSIEVAAWRKKGDDRFGVTDFTALDYVTFCIKAHYTDDMKDLVKEKMKDMKYPLRVLKNGQGILLANGDYQFIGEGKEVKL